MDFQNGRWSRGRRRASPQLRPEECNAAYRFALIWREEWRAERKKNTTEPVIVERPIGDEKKHRARFAAAIARAEFGRNYWDERRARTREAERRKPRRTGKVPD